jgi:hypothetical protein
VAVEPIPGYREEIDTATDEVGTRLLFENDRVRVWDLALEPGMRAPFHVHRRSYFWTCVEGGMGLQRFADRTPMTRAYVVGETEFSVHSGTIGRSTTWRTSA